MGTEGRAGTPAQVSCPEVLGPRLLPATPPHSAVTAATCPIVPTLKEAEKMCCGSHTESQMKHAVGELPGPAGLQHLQEVITPAHGLRPALTLRRVPTAAPWGGYSIDPTVLPGKLRAEEGTQPHTKLGSGGV